MIGEKNEAGGSSHGLWEVIYRLHASRFKALLRCVYLSPCNRAVAELEALRITEDFPHDQCTYTMQLNNQTVKCRIWNVLCDTVTAFTRCKKDNPFFHRSVYRHAQALLWSPVFLEDFGGDSENRSMQQIRLMGMDYEKTSEENAKSVIETLFDRKRMQLCAVWVTTPANPTPFEVLNDAARKYDALRWKYCLAYIDCLRQCNQKDSLETFMTWIDSSARDLPSFYEKSACAKGATPHSIHSKDNLLQYGSGIIADLTRYTNKAIADVLRKRLRSISPSQSEVGEDLLHNAYKCFKRLNCRVGDDIWKSLNVRKSLEEKKISEVEAICDCYIYVENGRSCSTFNSNGFDAKMLLLKRAVEKCESIFPSRSEQVTYKKNNLKRKLPDNVP
jgi:hypothetical protein